MQCDEFENRLNEVLDDRRPWLSDGELAAHARSCSACRDLAASYDAALSALVATALADARPGDVCASPGPSASLSELTARVLGELTPRVSLVGPSLRFLRQHQYQWAMAAGLLLAIGVGWIALSRGPAARAPGEPLAEAQRQQAPDSAPPRDKRLAAAPRHNTVGEKNAANGNLVANRTPPSPPQAADDGSPIDLSAASSLPAARWAHRVADGLKPVTQPTVGALNGFLELWGVDEPRPRS